MRNLIATAFSLFCAFAPTIESVAVAENNETSSISFVRDVAPILVTKCQACHGQKAAESNYRLDSFEAFLRAGDFGTPPVTAGDLESSEVYRLIRADDPEERMPNNGSRLTNSEIESITRWIAQGATFDGQDPKAPLRTQIPPDIPHPLAPKIYPHASPVAAMAFTEDGTQLVVGGYHELLIWDVMSGALVSRISNIPQRVLGMAFSPDYSCLTVVGGSPGVFGEVRLIPWTEDKKKTAQPKVLATYDDVFFAVAFRPDGTQLATGGADGAVRVFDIATGAEKPQINAHSDWVQSVCFSPDGNRIATASRDKTAKVFDVSSNTLLASFSEHGAPVRTAAFAPDGKSVISGGGSRLCVWNSDDAKLIGEMTGFSGDVNAVACQGDSVVAASADRTARTFKLVDRSLVRSLNEQPTSVVSLACHKATNVGGFGCFDGTVTIVYLDTGAVVRQFLALPSGKSQ